MVTSHCHITVNCGRVWWFLWEPLVSEMATINLRCLLPIEVSLSFHLRCREKRGNWTSKMQPCRCDPWPWKKANQWGVVHQVPPDSLASTPWFWFKMNSDVWSLVISCHFSPTSFNEIQPPHLFCPTTEPPHESGVVSTGSVLGYYKS